MSQETIILMGTALSIGVVHTLLGPDHYIPFIVMSKARGWSSFKTAVITFLCGLGHVLSSVVLGFLGIGLGVAVFKLETFESWRGGIAGWLLLIFGLAYCVWGIHRAIRNKPHTHVHTHDQGDHAHEHTHESEHAHPHQVQNKRSITPWVLFTIFIFGPCEPLIPVLMYPAAKGSVMSALLVAAVFSIATLTTMLVMVTVCSFSLARVPLKGMQRFSHALAGFTIFACGTAMTFLGL